MPPACFLPCCAVPSSSNPFTHKYPYKKQRIPKYPLFFMGWVMGFEPTNTGTTIRCLRPLGDTHHMKFCCRGERCPSGESSFMWHARRDSFNQGSAPSSRRRQRSSALHLILRVHHQRFKKFGTPEGTRTPDLLLRRQLLYPAELLAHLYGAGDGNRTRVSSLEGWCSTIELHPQILNPG